MTDLEHSQMISVIDLARELDKRKQHLFKMMKRLSIQKVLKYSSDARGQRIAYISKEDADRLRRNLRSSETSIQPHPNGNTHGVFYVIQLEPETDPGRLKLGFASDLDERLRKHRTAAPFSQPLRSWPCKPLWEKTAIDCLAAGTEQVGEEVFRTNDVAALIEKGDEFFAMMPTLE